MGNQSKRPHEEQIRQMSPLIALQRDQVESIAQQDVGEAAVVNSTVPTAERQEVFEALEEEELEFLFLAPEQFNNPDDDLKIRRFLASSGQVDAEEVEQVAAVVQEQDEPIKRRDLREQTGLSQAKVATALSRLEEVGVVEMLPTGEVVESEQPPEVSEAAQEAIRAQEHYQQYLRSASLVP